MTARFVEILILVFLESLKLKLCIYIYIYIRRKNCISKHLFWGKKNPTLNVCKNVFSTLDNFGVIDISGILCEFNILCTLSVCAKYYSYSCILCVLIIIVVFFVKQNNFRFYETTHCGWLFQWLNTCPYSYILKIYIRIILFTYFTVYLILIFWNIFLKIFYILFSYSTFDYVRFILLRITMYVCICMCVYICVYVFRDVLVWNPMEKFIQLHLSIL